MSHCLKTDDSERVRGFALAGPRHLVPPAARVV
jgi:hypothetical protein